MKKLLLVALSTVLLAGTVMAQQQTGDKTQQSNVPKEAHFVMKEGKMYHVTDGKEMPMQEAMTLTNGMMVHPDGSYMLKNGKQKNLSNGQCMDMKGKVYSSQHMFQQKMMQHNMNGKGHEMHGQGSSGGMMGKQGSHH